MNKTKRKIFETSMKLFAEKGYDATSIEEITATVGVAKGTLYYHFSSKEEIFNFLIEEGIKLLQNSIDIKTEKLDNYIDQILYYVRSENAEKDYIIKETSLNDIIKNVALKNKDDLLENNVDLIVDVSDEKVLTDSKWLEFILNQIINNSIKYKRDNIGSYIKIKVCENTNSVKLFIEDNGIGIPKNDLPQVFDKCFTGENGREKSKSTGMGLYIAKKLCVKLGHRIEIESEAGSFTRVVITFGKNDFCKMD